MRPFQTLKRLFPWLARKPRTFALVGKSGTGKSFKARQVARRFGIDLIIDDGLLIRGQKIVAGQVGKAGKGILERHQDRRVRQPRPDSGGAQGDLPGELLAHPRDLHLHSRCSRGSSPRSVFPQFTA